MCIRDSAIYHTHQFIPYTTKKIQVKCSTQSISDKKLKSYFFSSQILEISEWSNWSHCDPCSNTSTTKRLRNCTYNGIVVVNETLCGNEYLMNETISCPNNCTSESVIITKFNLIYI